MPWTAKDADSHKKGLSPKQQRQWAAVANAALEKCEKDGGSDCDASAIRQANAAVDKTTAEAAIGEATTMRHRARVLASDLDAILASKGLSDQQRGPLLDLRAALASTWGEITATEAEPSPLDPIARILLEAELVLAQDDSWDGRRMLIQQALMQQAAATAASANTDPYSYRPGALPYIEDVYDDTVVYCCDGCIYACGYTIGADDTVTLGEPIEVERAYVTATAPASSDSTSADATAAESTAEADPPPVPPAKKKRKKKVGAAPYRHATYAAESGSADTTVQSDLIGLIEAAVAEDGTVPIKVIAPGWGSSGYYPPDVLERDGPTVFPRGTHMYLDHPTVTEDLARPERSLRDLVAVFETDAAYEADNPAGPGLYARGHVFEPFRASLAELAPHIGVSIRAQGKTVEGKAEGRTGPIVEQLVDGLSVDFVTQAGAGGRVLEIVEAARSRPAGPSPVRRLPMPAPTGARTERAPVDVEGGRQVTEAEAKALREAHEKQAAELTETRQRLARMEEAGLLREALDIASSTLASIRMPDMTRERLLKQVAANPPIVEDTGVRSIDRAAFVTAIKEAATSELEYLAKTTGLGSGAVVGMGGRGTVEVSEADTARELEAAFSSFLDSDALGKVAATGRA